MRRGWVILSVIFLLLAVMSWVFYMTGGRGLVRVVRYSLMRNIPDSIYVWSDFVPNNESKRISGFYSSTFSNDNTVALWTLAGLKRYRHTEGSVITYLNHPLWKREWGWERAPAGARSPKTFVLERLPCVE